MPQRIQASRTLWSVTASAQAPSKGWPLPEKAMPGSNGLTQLSSDHAAGSPFNAWLRPDGTANVVATHLSAHASAVTMRDLCPALQNKTYFN